MLLHVRAENRPPDSQGSNAVVPLPDFSSQAADFLEPISQKSGSVNTIIGKSVTPNFITKSLESLPCQTLKYFWTAR